MAGLPRQIRDSDASVASCRAGTTEIAGSGFFRQVYFVAEFVRTMRPSDFSFAALRQFHRYQALACTLCLAGSVSLLHAMGRSWWCPAGDLTLWSSEINSIHGSQHFLDPYTATHVLHGIALYGLLWLLLRNRMTPLYRGVLAIGLESLWEVLENTPFVIDKYREQTLALGYYGDSVTNSVGDILACALGYVFAMTAPAWASLVAFVSTEALLLWWIRDSLLLNVLMLVRPVEAVKNWQIGG